MSLIYSKFYYGHLIIESNSYIDFDEGGAQITVNLRPGSYTLTEFAEEIATQMTKASTLPQTYIVSVSRETRVISISSSAVFKLRVSTGTHAASSAFSLIGFNFGDQSGATSYVGDSASGSEFRPQFPLQSLVDFDEQKEYLQSSVNIAASGVAEVVSFGAIRWLDCEMKFQTNIPQKRLILSDPAGVTNLKNFMEYAIQKGRMEFMLDQSDSASFVKCILESTPDSQQGTAYKLKRMIGENLWDYYETGALRFREVL